MLQVEHSAILSTFIKLSIVIKIFVSSIFEWPFYTGVTVPEKVTFYDFLYISSCLYYSEEYLYLTLLQKHSLMNSFLIFKGTDFVIF